MCFVLLFVFFCIEGAAKLKETGANAVEMKVLTSDGQPSSVISKIAVTNPLIVSLN